MNEEIDTMLRATRFADDEIRLYFADGFAGTVQRSSPIVERLSMARRKLSLPPFICAAVITVPRSPILHAMRGANERDVPRRHASLTRVVARDPAGTHRALFDADPDYPGVVARRSPSWTGAEVPHPRSPPPAWSHGTTAADFAPTGSTATGSSLALSILAPSVAAPRRSSTSATRTRTTATE